MFEQLLKLLTSIITNETLTKILLNVFFISVFISALFFTYGIYIEKLTIKSQMDILANEFTDIFKLFGKDNNIKLRDYIKNKLLSKENIKNLQKEDHHHMEGNDKIIQDVKNYIGYFTIFVVFIILLQIGIHYNKNVMLIKEGKSPLNSNLPGIFGESLVILVFIAITYITFITFFGSRYMSLDINSLKLEIIKNFKEYGDKL